MKLRVLVLGVLLGSLASLFAQDARLSNLSIRAQGGGSDNLVTGFTIGPGGNKTVLLRAVGPTLGVFGVDGALRDPKLVLYNGAGAKIGENDDFNASDAPTFDSVGAFRLSTGGKDAAIVATLAPGSYTAEVSGVGGSRGVALVEVYEVGASATRLVNLSTRAQVGTGDGILIPGLSITTGSTSRRLLIRAIGPTLGAFGVPGTLADPKLELYSGTTRIASNDNWETPAGNASGTAAQLAAVFSQAGAFALAAGSKDAAILTNLAPGNYTLQVSGVNNATGEALVEVYDLTEASTTPVRPNTNVYFASLRPGPNSGASLASGFAAITFGADDIATVSVNISNLSSAQTAAYLRLAGTNDYLLSLPLGQVAERPWVIGPIGIYSRDEIIRALNEGRIYVSLETAKYPSGEVAGTLVTSAGSRTFTAPTAPPALPASALSSPSDIDAARLLLQSTFGPTDATVAEVKRLGTTEWIKAQLALPATALLATLRNDATQFPNPLKNELGMEIPRLDMFFNHNIGWWKQVMTAPDQLRQRVGFALSEIFVIAGDEQSHTEPIAHYYDVLVNGAFGNFRNLIEQISLHTEMGLYLTYMRNQKADPVKGTSPDENYARELQQLFTVGLVQLQPDGTLLLDSDGKPIPTYDNITITETAKVLTGWAYQNRNDNFFVDAGFEGSPGSFSLTAFYSDSNGRLQPMKCYETYHDKTEKRVISLQQATPRVATPTIIPANQTGPADLRILLDTLFNHPNTGPFLSKQLIQRLVTSNPSAGYVYRVARVFADNGRGVRGDLGAVVTAILTDYEARSPDVAANVGYGKVKEPLLRATALMRVMKTAAPNGRFVDSYWYDPRNLTSINPIGFFSNFGGATNAFGQAAQHSPSVFNFFSPYYSAPGPLADYGLVAPEMQIVDSTFSIKTPNQLVSFIYKEPPVSAGAPSPSPFLRNDFTDLLALSGNASTLLDRLNLLLCGGQLSAATKAVVLETLQAIVPPTALTLGGTSTRFAVITTSSPLIAPKVAAFDPAGSFTIETWIFPATTTAPFSTWIMGKLGDNTGDPFRNYSMVLGGPGTSQDKVIFNVATGPAGSSRSITSSAAVPIGAWTHVAAVLEGTAMRIFINGQQVAQGTALGPPKSEPNAPFSVGAGFRSSGQNGYSNFNGVISQPRIWNVARTAAQISAAMNEAVPADKTGLVAGWQLNEGSGAAASDYSGNNYPLIRPETNAPAIGWVSTNGQSLDRVQTALHLLMVSPDAALQK